MSEIKIDTPVLMVFRKQLREEALTPEESALLRNWESRSPHHQALGHKLLQKERVLEDLILRHRLNSEAAWKKLEPKLNSSRISILPVIYRWTAAAAIIIMVLTATWLLYHSPGVGHHYTTGHAIPIPPGADKAILTIGNQTIALAPHTSGITIGKNMTYNDGSAIGSLMPQQSSAHQLMTLSTPNAAQYQLTLPDGTKAWLNAASSIQFPAVFGKAERRITVTGEVFLDIAKNKSKPFRVNVNQQQDIEVLGTSLNINAYINEPDQVTTLITGKIKVSPRNSAGTTPVILFPGDQATADAVRHNVDTTAVTAWKQGEFRFGNNRIDVILRQIARWYDIEIKYEGAIPNIRIGGDMPRSMQLSKVLEVLTMSGVRHRLEGRTLFIEA